VLQRAADLLPRLQARLDGGIGAPKLSRDALRDQGQRTLFIDDAKAAPILRRLREADLDAMTPLEALDLLRALKRGL